MYQALSWNEIEVVKLIVSVVAPLITLAAGWFIGQRILASWEIRKKQKEFDINSAVQFQQLYGELKEVGRLWRESRKTEASSIKLPDDLRWSLLARATSAESKYEAVVMKLASERELTSGQLAALGLFRQACQQLRQSIRKNQEISYTDYGPEYFLFNDLAAEVACLIGKERPQKQVLAGVACKNLEMIIRNRSQQWEDAVKKYHEIADQLENSNAGSQEQSYCATERLALSPIRE
jgi:hypothetical protein